MPKVVYLFMGKRKSGKDFVTELFHSRLKSEYTSDSKIIRLSGPIKSLYAEKHGLDLDKLLSASDYKEKYRSDMISWSEEIRNKDPGVFCRAALPQLDDPKDIWIVSDCRRKTDIQFFEEKYKRVIRVRIKASEKTRSSRGFVFKSGIDDAESECGLDDIDRIDIEITNDTRPDLTQLFEYVGAK